MADEKRSGWKGSDGVLYEESDPRLAGYGFPPSCPIWQQANAGMGTFPCVRVLLVGEPPKEAK